MNDTLAVHQIIKGIQGLSMMIYISSIFLGLLIIITRGRKE